MENTKIFDSWFRVDLRPFKKSLLSIVCDWGNLFKQYLVDHVINRYEKLMTHVMTCFIKVAFLLMTLYHGVH
jgi:dynein heavy chain